MFKTISILVISGLSFSLSAQFRVYEGDSKVNYTCQKIKVISFFSDNETPSQLSYETLPNSMCAQKSLPKPTRQVDRPVKPTPAVKDECAFAKGTSDYGLCKFMGGPGGCFVAGSEITMADGKKQKIEDVRSGDIVQTYNTETMKIEFARVRAVDRYETDLIADVTVMENREPNEIRHILMTVNHPIFIPNMNYYRSVLNLDDQTDLTGQQALIHEINDSSKIETGKIMDIRLNRKSRVVPVFNLVIESLWHNYFVNGLLVHNRTI